MLRINTFHGKAQQQFYVRVCQTQESTDLMMNTSMVPFNENKYEYTQKTGCLIPSESFELCMMAIGVNRRTLIPSQRVRAATISLEKRASLTKEKG